MWPEKIFRDGKKLKTKFKAIQLKLKARGKEADNDNIVDYNSTESASPDHFSVAANFNSSKCQPLPTAPLSDDNNEAVLLTDQFYHQTMEDAISLNSINMATPPTTTMREPLPQSMSPIYDLPPDVNHSIEYQPLSHGEIYPPSPICCTDSDRRDWYHCSLCTEENTSHVIHSDYLSPSRRNVSPHLSDISMEDDLEYITRLSAASIDFESPDHVTSIWESELIASDSVRMSGRCRETSTKAFPAAGYMSSILNRLVAEVSPEGSISPSGQRRKSQAKVPSRSSGDSESPLDSFDSSSASSEDPHQLPLIQASHQDQTVPDNTPATSHESSALTATTPGFSSESRVEPGTSSELEIVTEKRFKFTRIYGSTPLRTEGQMTRRYCRANRRNAANQFYHRKFFPHLDSPL